MIKFIKLKRIGFKIMDGRLIEGVVFEIGNFLVFLDCCFVLIDNELI